MSTSNNAIGEIMKIAAIIILFIVLTSCDSGGSVEPDALGWYAVKNKELVKLKETAIKQGGQLGHIISGAEHIDTVFVPQNSDFIIHSMSAAELSTTIRLSRLSYERIREIDGAFGKQTIELDLYTTQHTVDMKVIPSKKNSNIFRIIPVESLAPGPYALHVGHLGFAGTGFENTEVYTFFVRGKELVSETIQPLQQWDIIRSLHIHNDGRVRFSDHLEQILSSDSYLSVKMPKKLKLGTSATDYVTTDFVHLIFHHSSLEYEDIREGIKSLSPNSFVISGYDSLYILNRPELPIGGFYSKLFLHSGINDNSISLLNELIFRSGAEHWCMVAPDTGRTWISIFSDVEIVDEFVRTNGYYAPRIFTKPLPYTIE